MKYHEHYLNLIKKAQSRNGVDGYSEKHHIIPKSFGGSNKKDNIVELTGREHFIAHILLAKIYGKGMWQAAKMMRNKSGVQDGRILNGRMYEIAKKEWAKYASTRLILQSVKDSIRKSHIGLMHSEETKVQMSLARKGKSRSGDPSKWKHTDESKEKMRQTHIAINTGARLPRFFGDANPMKRPENRAKISASKKAYWSKVREQKLLNKGNENAE